MLWGLILGDWGLLEGTDGLLEKKNVGDWGSLGGTTDYCCTSCKKKNVDDQELLGSANGDLVKKKMSVTRNCWRVLVTIGGHLVKKMWMTRDCWGVPMET